ncbi:MAG: hypothetical protein ACK4F0_01875 [Candidatus Ratteibacteria bacterium]
MNNSEIKKIKINDNKIITLKEFFQQEERARKEQSKLPFEEKIKILVSLQKIASKWGGKKDVIVWKI